MPPAHSVRGWVAALVALACLTVPHLALSQGKCGYTSGRAATPWFSMEGGAGVSLPVPLSSSMRAKSIVPGFAGGVSLQMSPRGRVGLFYIHKEFQEQNSTFEYGKYNDLLVRGSLALVMRRQFQWDLHLLTGLSFVTIQFMDIDKTDPQTSERDGEVVVVGPIKRRQITTFTGGLGSRLVWFPVDPVGVFVDLSVLYAYQASLEPEDGAMNLNTIAGVEAHF